MRLSEEEASASGVGIEAASAPGAEEGGEASEGAGASGGAGAAADFALDDDGADAALGGVVGGRDGWVGDEREQLREVLGDPAAEGCLWDNSGVSVEVGLAVLALATLEMASVILTEAALDFLGLGIQPPESSWGLMLSQGRQYMTSAW